MSEENRFIKNKKTLALSISLIVVCILAGAFGTLYISAVGKNEELTGDYGELSEEYVELYGEYESLLSSFNDLNDIYFILTGEYIELENAYNALELDLIAITAERDALLLERDGLLQDIIDLETIIAGLESTITGLEFTIATLNSEIVNLGITISGLEFTIATLNSNIATLEAEIDALLIEIANLEGENTELEQYYLGLIAGLNSEIVTLTTERDALLIDLADMTTERNNLLIELADMTAQRDNLVIELDAMTIERDNLQSELVIMTAERDALEIALIDMTAERDALLGDYQILSDAYNALQIAYNALQIAYNYITDTIRQSILPVQYSIFTEAVRRYYLDVYLEGLWELDEKEYWKAFAEYCRDIILHDSWQENSFTDVSNVFSDALIFGNDTMYLAWYIMYWTFYPWLPYWGINLTLDELWGIDIVVDWCIDEIDYEYDSSIIDGQEYFEWDYIKFPVETAFRTLGDCEDQAILCAAYLESCGFEAAIVINHDPSHPVYGAFYHGSLLVHIEDTDAFWSLYPDAYLWTVPNDPYLGYTWCWLDTTWDVPFGSTPMWLQDYIDFGMLTDDIVTLAFCDIDGAIGENIDLTYVTPV